MFSGSKEGVVEGGRGGQKGSQVEEPEEEVSVLEEGVVVSEEEDDGFVVSLEAPVVGADDEEGFCEEDEEAVSDAVGLEVGLTVGEAEELDSPQAVNARVESISKDRRNFDLFMEDPFFPNTNGCLETGAILSFN